jgi:hypothetical protein
MLPNLKRSQSRALSVLAEGARVDQYCMDRCMKCYAHYSNYTIKVWEEGIVLRHSSPEEQKSDYSQAS